MANDFNPYIPEWWAMGALAVLNENLVALPLFNRDYSDMFAKGGQIINTRRPSKMTATRKHKNTAIAAQDVSAENVAIPLDQQIYNSFTVHDLDQQWSMEDLIQTYLRPAGYALAQAADRVVLLQAAQFLLDGKIVGTPTQTVYQNIVDSRTAMDNNLAPSDGRHMILNPTTEGKMLKDNLLIQQYSAGSTQALRAGIIGNLVGIDQYKTTNLKVSNWNSATTGVQSITNLATVVVGSSIFTATAQSSVATAIGDWVSIGGVPYKVLNVTGSGPYTFTVNRPIAVTVAASDKIYAFKGVTLNASYAAGWGEDIVLNPGANQYVPGVGDWLDIKGKVYGVLTVSAANHILLDRPLEDAVISGTDLVQSVPPGNYSFLAQRDSLTVVMRTLAPTKPGTGVLSATVGYNGMGVRAQMWYDPNYQKMQVSLDFLMGIKVLDTNMGMVVVS